jgi:ornithine carbamoyltransferase
VDGIVIRANRHRTVVDLAAHSTCPVINGLTDRAHPCQALADLYTLKELLGSLTGVTLAYIGDANNMARSLMEGCGRLGMPIVLATPKAYQFSAEEIAEIKREVPQLDLHVTSDPKEAVRGATAVYTDVWTSMGQEAENEARQAAFAPFQVNASLLRLAPSHCKVLHCLPARRGMEITDDVLDAPCSIVFQQAGNRLHVQKGLLVWLAMENGYLAGNQVGLGLPD